MTCPLCAPQSNVLYENDQIYIISVPNDENAPAFCRVIWKAHIKEMSELTVKEQQYLMGWVFCVEKAMREVLNPTKINLASFGNQVPHVHWHIIARFENDSCFPDSIWATPKRKMPALTLPENWLEQIKNKLINHQT